MPYLRWRQQLAALLLLTDTKRIHIGEPISVPCVPCKHAVFSFNTKLFICYVAHQDIKSYISFVAVYIYLFLF